MLLAYLQLAGAMILAGATVAVAKPVVAAVPVYVFGALRFVIAAAILVPLALRAGRRQSVTLRELATAVLLAFFGAFLFTVLILEGVARTSALDAAVITSTIPAATLLLSAVLLGERLTMRRTGAVGLATAGIAVLALQDATGGVRSVPGNLLVVGAVFSEAMFTVLAKRLGAGLAPVPLAAITGAAATLMFLPFAAMQVGHGGWPTIDGATWALIVFYATAGSVVAFLLWFQGLRKVKAGVAGAFTALIPVSGALIAVTGLGERFTQSHLGALVLALLAIALATWPERIRGSA